MPADQDGWQRSPVGQDARMPGSAPASPEAIGAPPILKTDLGTDPGKTPGAESPSGAFSPSAAYLDQLGEGSRRTMREALAKLAHWASDGKCDAETLPWQLLRIEHTAALRTRLAANLAPATANKHLAALRGVLKQCWRHGDMSAEAYQRAIDLPPVRGGSPRKSAPLGPAELKRLTDACVGDTSPAGARDEALLALLYGASLRRSEAVALDFSDYDLERDELTVRGANQREPRCFVANADARRALERWILIRGPEPGPLFNPVNKGGRIERRRLSEQAIYIACQKRASEAGLPPTSPEDLRRADASGRTRPARSDGARSVAQGDGGSNSPSPA
ncbi:MAG: tyrosine-type recombinase/integrase [Myxococcota bacterium]